MEQQSKLFIKGMVCNRCVSVVQEALTELGHQPLYVGLGEATVSGAVDNFNKIQLQDRLAVHGFSLLEDGKMKIVRELKDLVSEVYGGDFDFPEKFRFAILVKDRLAKEYETVRDVFIAMEQKTLEQYTIDYRINKVKELLVYSILTLADISFRLNFNSVAHLSAQFKQQTGLTASHFRAIKKEKADVIFSVN